ncbi:uncharacterized protein BDW70DRAFT_146625 [Aspergillus foveolatus]|uniref:uncharacterized protein n=1 Tax=Aspergillus foveolatus TaxID=210207 RepID=UPI003CCD2D55
MYLPCLLLLFTRSLAYLFTPDNAGTIIDDRIPVVFDVSASQTLSYAEAPISGFWITSFLTATDGSQYFLASGLLASEAVSAYGASLLDLQTFQRHAFFNPATFTNANLESFNFTTQDYELSGISPDNLAMKLSSDVPGASFDLTLHATSPAAYYYGTGAYRFVNDTMYNWAFPASKTSGSITVPGRSGDGAEQIELDPAASLTWYDRVWGSAELRKGNSTFFVLYVDDSDLILWMNVVESIDPSFRSRSVNICARGKSWHHIHAIDVFEPDADAVWTSPRTGRTYPQKWRLGIEGRGELHIKTVVGDQELAAKGNDGAGIYLGFSTFEGVLDGEDVTGFGVSELRLAGIV